MSFPASASRSILFVWFLPQRKVILRSRVLPTKRAVISTSRLEWTFAATHALQVSRMFWNPWRQIRINTVLAHRSTKSFARANLRLQLKYLVAYASRALSTQQRWTLLCKHYEFLQRYFSA